jgi:dTMP kinase
MRVLHAVEGSVLWLLDHNPVATRNLQREAQSRGIDARRLIFAARRDHIAQVIRPALARGEVVLCDRFTDATFAYQGGGHGFDLDVLGTLERWVQMEEGSALLQPALTLWFDLPAQVAAQRLTGARVPDKFEAQPQAFFEKVIAGYARRAALEPQRFASIHADQTPDAVRAEVLAALRTHGLLPA